MNKREISNVLSIALIALTSIFIVSCDKDDFSDPTDTVTLNMLNEDNGKTMLGTSSVYINKANNFFSKFSLGRYSLIADLGNSKGIGQNFTPKLTNLVLETAVVPGHSYQVFDEGSIIEFPSGTLAISLGATYYRIYAVSNLPASGATTGAVVKYTSVYPDAKGLPAYEQELGTMQNWGDVLEVAIPKGAEYYYDDYRGKNVFNMNVVNGKLRIELIVEPYDVYGTHTIYIRNGTTYSRVLITI